MRMACRGVDGIEPAKAFIDGHRDAGGMANRGDTTDCKPGGIANHLRFGDSDVAGPTEGGAEFLR
jgi:hypothetical protein